MLAWFGFSLAILIGPLSEKFALVEKVWRPISYILFPLSGTAFVVDALPRNVMGKVQKNILRQQYTN